MPDAFLDADEIRAATFIRHVEIHDTLGSTNDRAAELARDREIELPALIAARHQTAGRGRGKNTWWSADGALTFSVLLDPAALGISPANWPQLSLATAVAVCDALTAEVGWAPPTTYDNKTKVGSAHPTPCSNPQSEICGSTELAEVNPKSSRLAINWPNDVMLDGGKICGILIESPGGPAPAKDRLIIGIGINVNNSWCNTMRDVSVNGAALCDITSRQHDLAVLIVRLIHALSHRVRQLAENDRQLFEVVDRLCLPAGSLGGYVGKPTAERTPYLG